jgi:hypothetical protein
MRYKENLSNKTNEYKTQRGHKTKNNQTTNEYEPKQTNEAKTEFIPTTM